MDYESKEPTGSHSKVSLRRKDPDAHNLIVPSSDAGHSQLAP